MLKRGLIAVVAVAVLATVAQAGYVKTHEWPTTYVPQELTTIPVWIDVGYYVEVKDQTKNKIKLYQKTGAPRDYVGDTTITIKNNFKLTLAASVSPKAGTIGGTFTVALDKSDLDPGVNAVKVTVNGTNLAIENATANQEAEVATVKITVVPR